MNINIYDSVKLYMYYGLDFTCPEWGKGTFRTEKYIDNIITLDITDFARDNYQLVGNLTWNQGYEELKKGMAMTLTSMYPYYLIIEQEELILRNFLNNDDWKFSGLTIKNLNETQWVSFKLAGNN
jgi:hypothetical protein